VKTRILNTLEELRAHALKKGFDVDLYYHEEDSSLMRCANSAISLNTNEHLIRLKITAYDGRRRAVYGLITGLDRIQEMKQGIDTAAEMARHAQPLVYRPTLTRFADSFADERGYDEALSKITNEARLQYINQAAAGLESESLKLSGIFSSGTTTIAQINTRSAHTQFFRISDAQATVVLAHEMLKWEVSAEQSAHRAADLDPAALQRELNFLAAHYQCGSARQIPLGRYTIVFGTAATAALVKVMNRIGFNGGMMKRGYSFLKEADVGRRVFSEKFTLFDDPGQPATFPFRRDFAGIPREPRPLFDRGVFQGFIWTQDDADEFGARPTGHTVGHNSLVLRGGDWSLASLEELANMPRDRDLLYIPFLHYMNIVDPSRGGITASSRFGALLLEKDGAVSVPYNVRLTQSLPEIFGQGLAWLSQDIVPYNVSGSYGARNPTALVVPNFTCVEDLEISHANSAY
jgi:predicted Zn-dependent protease